MTWQQERGRWEQGSERGVAKGYDSRRGVAVEWATRKGYLGVGALSEG